MGNAFGHVVKQRLAELGLSQRVFARQVGLSHANINKIINSSHEAPPPPQGDDLERWATVLQIPAAEHQRFCDLAALGHLPWTVRARWEAWYDTHQQLLADHSRLHNELAQLRRAAEPNITYDQPT
jgi:transcriptional regulator with XRE-family HTH domain